MSTAAPPFQALTAEQFALRADPGHPEELVEGRIISMPPPKPRHGEICGNVSFLLRLNVEAGDLGKVLTNDSAIVTERDPDSVRGADVAFYSFDRIGRGPLPAGYLPVAPELVVEVLSPDDRWPATLRKVAEYLAAGVLIVVVLDDDRRAAHVYTPDGANRILGPDEVLTLPEVLPGFSGSVRRIFG
jgi:Uma2 family endonuclease